MSFQKLDRTAFKAQSIDQAADHSAYYRGMTWQDRLRVAAYLNSVAFNYPESQPPKMDKSRFGTRSNKS